MNTSFFSLFLVAIMAVMASADDDYTADAVTNLPGVPENITFNQYAGYVTVDENEGRQLFYWLFECPYSDDNNNGTSCPLILWLNGGPGCSSVAYGAAEELGPFQTQSDGSLSLNPNAWNQEASIIFLDSPAGVGYSYSNNSDQFLSTVGDNSTTSDALQFLRNWLERFSQYKNRPFYIAGESYSGHYIPELAQLIVNSNIGVDTPDINLKGILMGNPLLDDRLDSRGMYEFWWDHGLISTKTLEQLKDVCTNDSILSPQTTCSLALSNARTEMGGINPYNIYGPSCAGADTTNQTTMFGAGDEACRVKYTQAYMNRPEVRQALHASNFGSNWTECSYTVRESWTDSPKSMLSTLKQLINAQLALWIYSGDTDSQLPLSSTRYSIRGLARDIVIEWHPWVDNNSEVGGWQEVYDGVNFIVVRGAGHEVPALQPERAFQLFKQFLTNQPLPKYGGD